MNNPYALERWQRLTPWLEPRQITFSSFVGARPRVEGSRHSLGWADDERHALLFGSAHGGKDLATAFRALDGLSGWQLVAASGCAAAYRAWAASHGDLEPAPVLIDGYVDLDTRAQLFSAADAVVLSFRERHDQDSGILMDALAAGTAVAYSEGPEAQFVREYRLGEVFDPGDVESLRAALWRIHPPTDDDLAAARKLVSPHHTAGIILNALGIEHAG